MSLANSKTLQNLKDAFAGESQANRRYLYFAQKADVEGYNDVAAVFRSTAEGETGHAHGHLEYLEGIGDPLTGVPIGDTRANLRAAIHGETCSTFSPVSRVHTAGWIARGMAEACAAKPSGTGFERCTLRPAGRPKRIVSY